MLTIEKCWEILSAKYDRTNERSNQNEGKYSEKELYVNRMKGTCYNCGKYGHNSRYCTNGKENK